MLATSVLDFGCPKGPLASSEDANGSLAQQSSFLSCLFRHDLLISVCLFSPFSWFSLAGGADFLPFPPALLSIPLPYVPPLWSPQYRTASPTRPPSPKCSKQPKRRTRKGQPCAQPSRWEYNSLKLTRIPKMIGFQRYLISNMAIYMVFILNFSRVSLKLDEKRPYLPVVNGLINYMGNCGYLEDGLQFSKWLITMVIASPLRIGLWDPFQMAFLWLIQGGDPNHLQVLGWSSKYKPYSQGLPLHLQLVA